MTDRVAEHYQENPEGARLVSEDISGQGRKTQKKSKSGGRPEKAEESAKPSRNAKPAGAAKPMKPHKASVKTSTEGKKLQKERKKPEKQSAEAGEQSQSVKTPSVMRLVEERAFSENQVVAAGKSLIPRQLRGIEPLSRVMRRESGLQPDVKPDEVSSSPMTMRDLTEMVIAASVPEILRRFNACDCERCQSELARLTAEEIPARYMKMPELADIEWGGFSSDERLLIDSLKKNAVTVMIRLMIANKKRNFH